MKKIPNVFEYASGGRGITDDVRPGCGWALRGEGLMTEKLDGTNVRLTIRSGIIVRVEKRRNPAKKQKQIGIIDPWYVDTSESDPSDQWILSAAVGPGTPPTSKWPDGEHCCEAIGPKIQGNPLALSGPMCMPFDLYPLVFLGVRPTNFAEMYELVVSLESMLSPGRLAEGIVFHHPDGRRAKIRRKDFLRSDHER